MKNAQEVLRRAPPSAAAPGPNTSSASAGANASASSGPGVGERLSEWAGARLVAGHRWWSQLTPDQQKLLLAGAALGVLVLLYNLYQAFFGCARSSSFYLQLPPHPCLRCRAAVHLRRPRFHAGHGVFCALCMTCMVCLRACVEGAVAPQARHATAATGVQQKR